MSRRTIWFAVTTLICVTLAVMVYSMQLTNSRTVSSDGSSVNTHNSSPVTTQANANTQDRRDANKNPDTPKVLCTLNTQQAPDLFGLRLGMNVKQILAAFPGAADDPEVQADVSRPPSDFGETRFLIKPEKYGSKEKFAGIKTVIFGLMDGRVSDINLSYNGPPWKNVDEFVTKFSESTNLPGIEAWDAQPGMDTQLKNLNCDGFGINVFSGGRGGNLNYVKIRDLSAEKQLDERRAKVLKNAVKPS